METPAVVAIAAGAFLAGWILRGRGRTDEAPLPPPAPIDPKAIELARSVLPIEGKIGAIKAYREATGCGLRDAKLAVDTIDDR
ncbi:MAG: hypothetical protein H6838_06270 [Planctomycetes bacterium]|nr:hypothetical protein [Planctomycetota bacterium]MCB9885078.1 hypothetical protein [Planctomycetota bacterium]